MVKYEYSDMIVRVAWEVSDKANSNHTYGKIVGGRYDGALLRQDGWAMLILQGGSWVRLVDTTPDIITERQDKSPSKKAHKVSVDLALQTLRARVVAVLNIDFPVDEDEDI